MKKWLRFLLSLLTFGMVTNSMAASVPNQDISDIQGKCLILALKDGDVKIRLKEEAAPNHVRRIIELTNQGFYNGLTFHRVIVGFMAQTGDPKGDGTGGSGKNLKAEFSREKHIRGTVSMARAASPDSADSQFFIMFAPSIHLDGQYTVFGQVEEGMEFVDTIKKGDQADNGSVDNPDKILDAKIADC
jgi:peptidylprolyl isomerase